MRKEHRKWGVLSIVLFDRAVAVFTRLAEFARQVRTGECFHRTSVISEQRYGLCSDAVDRFVSELSTPINDDLKRLLELVGDAITCPDAEYEHRWYAIWDEVDRLNRKISETFGSGFTPVRIINS